MYIAILEPKIKSKWFRLIVTLVLIVATIVLPAILLSFLDKKILMIVQGASTILLFIILIKIINGYKIIGTIEITNEHWIIDKIDFKKSISIQDIKKINFKVSLGMSKVFDGNTSYIADIILKNNELYVLEISREELKNGKLVSTNVFNMNSRFDLFKYLKKKRIKYDW